MSSLGLPTLRIHGGPDAQGALRHDFSTNSNACGPCPQVLAAVQAADATRYPDSSYTALRERLAAFHGVDAWRIVLAGSASEFIFRITAWTAQQGGRTVHVPAHAYGDYAHAAQAWGLSAVADADAAALVWACEPSSPLGQAHGGWPASLGRVVLDSAYAPLRLSGAPSVNGAQRDALWQLFSPNKALGLTGVRAAYAIAPLGAEAAVQQLEALAPSWPVGAHGVAMLMAWTQADTQSWLQASLLTLAGWKPRQLALLQNAGWTVQPSDTPFFCARPPVGVDAVALCAALRAQGIKLRDAASFGLPGQVRLGVLSPQAQDALLVALTYLSTSSKGSAQ
jgi:histidinol-phosphate aminotransferase